MEYTTVCLYADGNDPQEIENDVWKTASGTDEWCLWVHQMEWDLVFVGCPVGTDVAGKGGEW